jgi:HEAT repeat protein
MRESLASPNDRLRSVAYSYFEHNPDPSMIAPFLDALDKEVAEFVRPSLVRALAALGTDPRVRSALVRESGRGQDYFRSAVIEALGDYKARYAVDALLGIAKLDGPLADDAALALGKIGDRRARDTLIDLQHNGAPTLQPSVVAALCLIGDACAPGEKYLVDALTYAGANAGNQELLRGAAAGLGAWACRDA